MIKEYIGAIGLGGESVFLNVDHFHSSGETLHANNIYIEPGGKAYNQIVESSRLGAKTMFISKMGNDNSKDLCVNFLKKEGIESFIEIDKNEATAYATILTDKNGENEVTVYTGASINLTKEYIRSIENEIKKCKVLLLGLECSLEAIKEALLIAEENNIFTIFNPAPATKLDIDFLKKFDIITPNMNEAGVLFNKSLQTLDDLINAIKDSGLSKIIVTLGKDGALLYKDNTFYKFDSIKRNAVDTTGAGDSFNGALAYGILNDYNLIDSIKLAINVSSLEVTKNHVMESLPNMDEVKENYININPIIIK